MSSDCLFCRIVSKEVPARVVWESNDALAFLDVSPAASGHTLVIPKTHATDIFDISPESLTHVTKGVKRVADILESSLNPDGMSLFQSNRAVGWQEIFHLHVHVVPRYSNDELVRPWHSNAASSDHLDEVFALINA